MKSAAVWCLTLVLAGAALAETGDDFDPVTMDVPVERIDTEHPPAVVELAVPSHGEHMGAILYTANGPGPHPTVVLLPWRTTWHWLKPPARPPSNRSSTWFLPPITAFPPTGSSSFAR
jgi:hypothetical protein